MSEQPYDSRADTEAHIALVAENLRTVGGMLAIRAQAHDQSKLQEPEKPIFDAVTPRLKGLTYGSDEYKASLAEMKPALDHHYAMYSHHPEFQAIMPDGSVDQEYVSTGFAIGDMSLLDLIEMICDWYSATQRHTNGDFGKSMNINRKRFGIGDQLFSILVATAIELNYLPKGWTADS